MPYSVARISPEFTAVEAFRRPIPSRPKVPSPYFLLCCLRPDHLYLPHLYISQGSTTTSTSGSSRSSTPPLPLLLCTAVARERARRIQRPFSDLRRTTQLVVELSNTRNHWSELHINDRSPAAFLLQVRLPCPCFSGERPHPSDLFLTAQIRSYLFFFTETFFFMLPLSIV